MAWTAVERGKLLAHYWTEPSPVLCPTCRQNLQVAFRSEAAGYLLEIRCPCPCDSATIASHEDPLRDKFRMWTEVERQHVLRDHLGGRAPTCPACGTGLFVSASPGRGGDVIVAHCGRCLNHAETIAKRE
jgi:hypothetical protein